MLRYRLTHPEILAALGAAGHGSTVLLADGNYPHSTGTRPGAALVHLNYVAGSPTTSEVLDVVLDAIVVEAAAVMAPDDGSVSPVVAQFEAALPGIEIARLARRDFYAAGRCEDLALTIATGDLRWYSNILLTIGALEPPR